MTEPSETTRLLRQVCDGEKEAAERLLSLIYDELHAIARREMARQKQGHTLQPTALLNEAWIRLVGQQGEEGYRDHTHFMGVAARAMRNVLVDHARRKQAEKRGGQAERVDLDLALESFKDSAGEVVLLDDALRRLASLDEGLARIVELRFFGGLNNSEVAHVLDMSLRSVERGWRTARAWLHGELRS